MAKYNHAFTVAITVENELEDGNETPLFELLRGMRKRTADLAAEENGTGREAFECYDTYVVEEEPDPPDYRRCEGLIQNGRHSQLRCEKNTAFIVRYTTPKADVYNSHALGLCGNCTDAMQMQLGIDRVSCTPTERKVTDGGS